MMTGSNKNQSAKIRNIIMTANLGQPLNLDRIKALLPDSVYNPGKFNAIIHKVLNPKATLLLFRTGKVVCLGGRSESESVKALNVLASHLADHLGLDNICVKDCKIENCVASGHLGVKLDLRWLYNVERKHCRYLPEEFPALHYFISYPKLTALVFPSGAVIITGGKNEKQVITAYKKLEPILKLYEFKPCGVMSK